MSKSRVIALLVLLPLKLSAAPLADYTFKSPAFNGSGYSSHVLTIENQEATRRKALEDKIQAAVDKAKADAANTNMSKFLSNLESRVYAQISQNLAAAMFKSGSTSEGSFVMTYKRDPISGNYLLDSVGNKIPETSMSWFKTLDGDISITVIQPGQPPTTIIMPLSEWTF
jgi:hypothetical protein